MDALIRLGEATKRYAAGGTARPGPAECSRARGLT
jgi:hypothetical protein